MLRIRDLLVRVRILGSVPLITRSRCGWGGPRTYGSYGFGSGCGSGTLVHLDHSSKIKKVIKKSQNNRNQKFFLGTYYFCLIMEAGAGSVLVTNGSGCGRPKHIRSLRTRKRNTACKLTRRKKSYKNYKPSLAASCFRQTLASNPVV